MSDLNEYNERDPERTISLIVEAATKLVTHIHDNLPRLQAMEAPNETDTRGTIENWPRNLTDIVGQAQTKEPWWKEYKIAHFLETQAHSMYGPSTSLKSPPVYILNGHRGQSMVGAPINSIWCSYVTISFVYFFI
jgi:hypothetical protein